MKEVEAKKELDQKISDLNQKETFKNKIEKEKQDVEQRITTLMQEKQNLEKEFQQLEEKNAAANIDYEKASEEEKIAKDEFKKIEERHHSLFSKSIDLLSKYQKKEIDFNVYHKADKEIYEHFNKIYKNAKENIFNKEKNKNIKKVAKEHFRTTKE
ncbi:hypothetical protein [Mycoplasmopsis cynos]|uniref:hypothetical protein n=1 Tax=Mycoplasmopsis cynos TaxID=171284 RepID=UPI0024CA1A5A|nr:hypothetical protein [Mycoplasmopsis cynos]WAM04540.1 hypothetical protein ONA01_06115 [Mycoplasmopsis cynos]